MSMINAGLYPPPLCLHVFFIRKVAQAEQPSCQVTDGVVECPMTADQSDLSETMT